MGTQIKNISNIEQRKSISNIPIQNTKREHRNETMKIQISNVETHTTQAKKNNAVSNIEQRQTNSVRTIDVFQFGELLLNGGF